MWSKNVAERWRLLSRRQRAQTLVLFALMLPFILGGVGLSIDIGNVMVQRRIAQNAADAAALAGMRCLYQQAATDAGTCRPADSAYSSSGITGASTTAPTLDAFDAVNYWAWKNSQGPISLVTSPRWITYTSGTWGETTMTTSNCCDATSPSNASGVRVEVTRTFDPYFIAVAIHLAGAVVPTSGLFNASGQLVVTARASAQVDQFFITGDKVAPWSICGFTQPRVGAPEVPGVTDGQLDSVLIPGNTNTVDYANKTGRLYYLQHSNVNSGASGWLPPPPACPENNGSSYKGKIDVDSPEAQDGITPPEQIPTDNGNGNAGDPCTATGQGGAPCYLYVPVTDDQNTVLYSAHVTTFACMWVEPRSGNNVVGRLANPSFCNQHVDPTAATWTKATGTVGSTFFKLSG